MAGGRRLKISTVRVRVPPVAPNGEEVILELAPDCKSGGCTIQVSSILTLPTTYRDVAQSGSASALGAEGRRFESCHLDQYTNFRL